ncbi:hypothetical protein [Priestia megaterium]|uniref:hypothetical protein n=1 Tax=Priestia megaterium TaxID=1404 RepID=UPI002877CDC8|nr:hypothetical protein [Priestia megaterium]
MPPIGEYHIQGVVNANSGDKSMNLFVLQATRFKVVMDLAKQLVAAIEEVYPLNNELINNTYITAVK